MRTLHIDLETFSSVDLSKSGVAKYVASPDFEILLFGYCWGDAHEVQVVDLANGENIPFDVQDALKDPSVKKHAYNAVFEMSCLGLLNFVEQWHCSMVHGLYCGYPSGLAKICEAMNFGQDKSKLTAGKALIKTFCAPCKPTKTNGQRVRNLAHHEPKKWELFKDYCKQDIVAEMEVSKRLAKHPMPDFELSLWYLDVRMNYIYGVGVDMELVENAIDISESTTQELINEAKELTGLDNPNSTAQLKLWLESENLELDNLQKATVSGLIDRGQVDGKAKRLLEIRQMLSKSSIKKYIKMRDVALGGRAHGLLQFYGANRTGRWAGRLVQVQNLPRNSLETLDIARQLVKESAIDTLKIVYGNVSEVLSQLIRTAFVPNSDCKFVVADFAAIEARVIAWLAGEAWRLKVFATHGKIYEASASQMFGVPIEKICKGNKEYDLRQKGKVAELALGYQGGKNALIAMGALNMGLSEQELPEIVARWRSANPQIVDLWHITEKAALAAMQSGYGATNQGVVFRLKKEFLTIKLPSGRELYYVAPKLVPNKFGAQALTYVGVDQTTGKFKRVDSYGGKLVENIVQAIARDCLAQCLEKLSGVSMHIHDEVVINAPKNLDSDIVKNKICKIMGEPISWAEGLHLSAEAFVTDYYKKE